MNDNEEILAGMGGFVKNSQGKLSFIFSGPSKVFGSAQLETNFLLFMKKT